ncbi:MAG: NPCBM/NEW2 domain-containing protein [Planctomycetaceae bacterium]|jgi:hypothetical protein|nr:NPCBM/NEW2 domain-containing protein [Planctomycetaceae bacterium]
MKKLFLAITIVLCAGITAAKDVQPAFEPVSTKTIVPASKAEVLRVDLNGADDIYLVADYAKDSYDSDQAVWAEPMLYDADGNAVRLTTLKPVSAKTGWGTMLIDKDHSGKPLTIAKEKFQFGIYAHAPSIIHYKLDGKYKRLETKVGLNNTSERGTVTFQIQNKPANFPNENDYTKNYKSNKPAPAQVPDAANTEFQFNPVAAKTLIDRGIEEVLFIRRLTYNSDHVYVEYLNSAWMPGGGICALNLKTGKVREIVPELTQQGVVGWFDLSFDAKKIVFDFKKSKDEGYKIYEVNVDGTGLRQVTFPVPDEAELVKKYRIIYHSGTDDMDPCYLPDGGIAFVSTRCQYSVLCHAGDAFTVKNLYRINSDGTGLKQLTVSPLSEATPTMLHDGRILYHRWEYVDKAAGNCKALWSMNPDGSGTAEVYGNTIAFPETKIQARAIPGEHDKIVMLGASHWINNAVGTVIIVDTSKPIRSEASMKYVTDDVAAFAHDGFHFKDQNGKWYHNRDGKPGRLFRNPYPLSINLFLASMKPAGMKWSDPRGYGLVLLDESGRDTELLKDSSVSLWQPYPVVSRPVPPQRTKTAIDPELASKGLARCVVTDVYAGMDNVKRGDVKYIRILEQLPRPWAARRKHGGDEYGMSYSSVGNGSLSVKVQHGIVPVEEDGSAHFLVPSGKAIYFQALDKNFCAIQTERTYVNYNAGETRSCVGCHETPDMTPPRSTSAPKSMLRAASIPTAQPTQTEAKLVFDYDRQIQPILDRHCVSCHQGKEAAQKAKAENNSRMSQLDLRGIPHGTFSTSYNSLIKLSNERQLLGNRHERDENNASNQIRYIPPNKTGALTSPLAAMLLGWEGTKLDDSKINDYTTKLSTEHADLKFADKLSEAEKLTVINWLDINCQFHPSYWGKKNAKYQAEADYRPALTFEEASSKTVPTKLQTNPPTKADVVKK